MSALWRDELAGELPNEFGGMRTRAPAMRHVFSVLERLARTDLAITLLGETGVGKSRLARAVHSASPRAAGGWVVLDSASAALSGGEARLVNPDAAEAASGLGDAHAGSLFIEEAAELSAELQSLLLRTLESGRLSRASGATGHPFDLRVIAASSRELEAEVGAGRFRQDLYFRLAAAVVRIPPLRERRDDIPLLVNELLAQLGRPQLAVSPDALALLQARQWLGNIRELKNTLAYALALLEGDRLELRDLERMGLGNEASALDQMALAGISLEQLERTAIKQTLARVRGNKVRAAKQLGIAVSTLYEKLKRFSID